MRFALLVTLCLAAIPVPAVLAAQETVASHLARGDSLRTALQSAAALVQFQDALQIDSASYEANWKAAREIADVAKQLLGDSLSSRRDSLYSIGRTWAERAVRLDSTGVNGHFALALVLGRLSLTKGSKERVKYAKIIYDEAFRATQLDSAHDGAEHILGQWNAEVKRLSGLQRFFAKALFGGGFMDKASWEDAVKYLTRAAAHNPAYIYHHLALAAVYVDLDSLPQATKELETVATLPVSDPMDPTYKTWAAEALADLKADKKGDAKDRLRHI
jgi:regulator of microtubule dynamics protein 3